MACGRRFLFYPIWLFADNTFYAALTERTPLAMHRGGSRFRHAHGGHGGVRPHGQPFAAHRAASRGEDKDTYLRRQRVWAVASVVAGCAMIAAATYYNLVIRPTVGA